MSATVDAGAAMDQGRLASFGTAMRLIAGWFSVAIASLDLLLEIDRPSGASDGSYLVFHVVWLVGGALLLALARIDPRPGRLGYLAGGAATAVGMIVGAVPATSSRCCMSGYSTGHGYPFVLLARHDAGRWHVDGLHVFVDLLFWAAVGLTVLVVASLLGRSPTRPSARDEPVDQERRQYIEHHGHAEEQAEQKTVGPLP